MEDWRKRMERRRRRRRQKFDAGARRFGEDRLENEAKLGLDTFAMRKR